MSDFYGFRPTISEIMKICHVSRRTAKRWLSGESEPPAPMLRLIELEITGRIMPASWPAHWRFNHLGMLESETCTAALKWQQLTWFNYVCSAWHKSLSLIPEIEASIDYLMKRLPRADVVQLEAYREELARLKALGHQSPYDVAQTILEPGQEKIISRSNGC